MSDSQTREFKLYHDFALEPLAARGCIRICNKNQKQANRIVPYFGAEISLGFGRRGSACLRMAFALVRLSCR